MPDRPPTSSQEPKRLGMDELSYFAHMVKFAMNQVPVATEARFWATISKHCPNLNEAIRASFAGEYAHLTFTRSIHSAAFTLDDADEPEREEGPHTHEREETPS